MNSTEYFLTKDTNINTKEITLPKLTDNELNVILEYVEYTRHIQEIDYLFRVFKTNLETLLFHYQLNTDDTVIRKTNLNIKENDFVIINSLIINYISSAKTFTESVENFIQENLGDTQLNKFKSDCLSNIYDNEFSYRLLIRLRDYSQHGHLPVNITRDGKYSFDLNQILNTPHFKHNGKLQDEMIKLRKEIEERFKGYPRIVFVLSIAKFQLCILEIYLFFINTIKIKLQMLKNSIDKIIIEKTDIIYKSNDMLNGLIIFGVDKDSSLHCIDPKDDSVQMIKNIQNNIEIQLENEQKEYNKLINNYCFKGKRDFNL